MLRAQVPSVLSIVRGSLVGWWPTLNLADVLINVGIVLTVPVALRTTSLDGAAAD